MRQLKRSMRHLLDRGPAFAPSWLRGMLVVALMASANVASAQGAAADDRPAEAVYKNIKALKGTPASQLNQSMHLIKGALGVDDQSIAAGSDINEMVF